MAERNITGAVEAWVDNFLVFAHSSEEANEIMKLLRKNLDTLEIKCKEVDTTGVFVGLERVTEGVALKQSFREDLTVREGL